MVMLVGLGACTSPVGDDVDSGRPEVPVTPFKAVGMCDVLDTEAVDTVAALDAVASQLDEAVALGMDVVRPHRPRGHVFSHNAVEPTVGAGYDWTLPDHVVALAQDRDLYLFPTVYPHADLGVSPPGLLPVEPPADPDAYSAWLTAMVERYDGDGIDDMPGLTHPIRTWEIFNEPNCDLNGDVCAQTFADLVALSYAAAKRADADGMVVAGASVPIWAPSDFGVDVNPEARFVYQWFIAEGGLQHTDALNFHYTVGWSQPDLSEYLSYWGDRAGDLPLWLTETGTRSPQDRSIISGGDPQAEADWATTHLDQALAGGVSQVFWCRAAAPLTRAPAVWDALHSYVEGL